MGKEEDELQEVAQAICEAVNMPQCAPASESATGEETKASLLPDPATMRPTSQAILWLSDLIANSQLKSTRVTLKGPSLNQQQVQEKNVQNSALSTIH